MIQPRLSHLVRLWPGVLLTLTLSPGPSKAQGVDTFFEGSVTVRELSVAGYWISNGEKAVLLDALIHHDLGPDEETLELLEAASAPFDAVDLILITHSHRDHFSAESVARHLSRNPEAVVVGGRLVREGLAQLPEFGEFEHRIRVVDPEPGEVVELEANGIALKVFRVSHGEPDNSYGLDNLAIMADVGGTKIFTTGDIDPRGQTEVFRQARLDLDSIDFAFLAFTMFMEEFQPDGMSIVDELIRPRHMVVAHLYESHHGELTEAILERYPGAIIFSGPTTPSPSRPLTVWYLGHCGSAVRVGTKLLVFDYLSQRGTPAENPGAGGLDDGTIDPADLRGLEVYVFATHPHEDHYDPAILAWEEEVEDIEYVFGWEAGSDPDHHYLVGPRATAVVDGMEIYTINSHHSGVPEVAYLVHVEDRWIYHNGDYRQDYIPDFQYLGTLTDHMDLVFHAGLTNEAWQYTHQAYYLMEHFSPDAFFPIHNGGNEEVALEFARLMPDRGYDTFIPVPRRRGDRWELGG